MKGFSVEELIVRTLRLISGGPNAWTDAYLAAFAGFENMIVVTFDRRFRPLDGCSVLTLQENGAHPPADIPPTPALASKQTNN